METIKQFNYSNVQSKEDINIWLNQNTQNRIDESKAYVHIDNNKNTWIEYYNIKIGFNILVILKLKEDERYACHSVEGDDFINSHFPFPNHGLYNSYEEMITGLTTLYSKGWKLN
jgi:hypothetical protein